MLQKVSRKKLQFFLFKLHVACVTATAYLYVVQCLDKIFPRVKEQCSVQSETCSSLQLLCQCLVAHGV